MKTLNEMYQAVSPVIARAYAGKKLSEDMKEFLKFLAVETVVFAGTEFNDLETLTEVFLSFSDEHLLKGLELRDGVLYMIDDLESSKQNFRDCVEMFKDNESAAQCVYLTTWMLDHYMTENGMY